MWNPSSTVSLLPEVSFNLRFIDPAPPAENKVPTQHHESLHTSTTPTNRGRKRLSPGSIEPRTVWKPQPHSGCLLNPNLGFQSHHHPGRITCHPRIRNPSIHLQPQQTGDENSDPPGQYRSARCGNPNLGFEGPAPPWEDKVQSQDHKSFHIFTTPTNRGRRR